MQVTFNSAFSNNSNLKKTNGPNPKFQAVDMKLLEALKNRPSLVGTIPATLKVGDAKYHSDIYDTLLELEKYAIKNPKLQGFLDAITSTKNTAYNYLTKKITF